MRWIEAVKLWNAMNIHHDDRCWAVPKKGTPDYDAVKKIMDGEAAKRSLADVGKGLDTSTKSMINEIVESSSKNATDKATKRELVHDFLKQLMAYRRARKIEKAAKPELIPEMERKADPDSVKLHLLNEISGLEEHLEKDAALLNRANLTPTQRNEITKEDAKSKRVLSKMKKELKELSSSKKDATDSPKKIMRGHLIEALRSSGEYIRDEVIGCPLKDEKGEEIVKYDKAYFLGKLNSATKMSKAKLAKMFKDLPAEFYKAEYDAFMASH